jgi:4-hydroxy-2-oxoheptanedioate aldolase
MPLPGFSLARSLRAGKTVVTGWCGLPAPIIAEVLAREGFAAVSLDQQHGSYDIALAAQAFAAIRAAGSAPITRIPLGDYATAARALDLGAEGVIAPMINNVADARAFVAATKFPPLGERSWGPARVAMLTGIADQKDYLREANAETVTFAMIETRMAVQNAEAIAAVPGVDALFVGPSDLSITLSGGRVLDPHSAEVEAALQDVVAAARKHDKIAGLYCATAQRVREKAKAGFQFFALGSDLGWLRAAAAEQLKKLKG